MLTDQLVVKNAWVGCLKITIGKLHEHFAPCGIPADSLTMLTLRSVNGEFECFESGLSKWFPHIVARSRKDRRVIEEVIPLGEFGVLTMVYPE